MENNEKDLQEQNSKKSHPQPSDDVRSDIETVTPDTENRGLEDLNTHESKDKGTSSKQQGTEEENTQESKDKGAEPKDQKTGEESTQAGSDVESEDKAPDGSEQSSGDNVQDGVETVSP